MAQTASVVTNKLRSLFAAGEGLPGTLSVIADLSGTPLPTFSTQQLIAQNVAPDVIEKSVATKYPAVHVYCSKVSNQLREKFRTFSGQVEMVAEVRVSQDRLEGLETVMQLYTDAVTRVLDQNRGDWGSGVFYTGGYEIAYGPVKHGGKNFLQIAKITFTAELSSN
jgi:hypothetical protein